MRLTDLDPRWFAATGTPRIGLTFLCPHCRTERLGVVFHHAGHEAMEDAVIRAAPGEKDVFIWTMTSPEDFSVLTLTPSVDASHAGHAHFHVSGGEIV
jgi:hypothetical protein